MGINQEAYNFYENGAEIGRLERGIGKLEAARAKELLLRWLPEQATIYDIGGGVGYYANWLAGLGHKVTMLELAPAAVEYAKSHQTFPYTALAGDARYLPFPDHSASAVLLMGPLYHLLEKEDRLQTLREACRVLAPGGVVAAAGISAFSSLTWALTVYGEKNNFLDDPVYWNMISGEVLTGEHHRPPEYPNFIAQAYFHRPEELKREVEEAGFQRAGVFPLEGCAWLTPRFEEKWADPASRERLLNAVRLTENDPSLLGISPHFLCIANK